MSDLAIRVDNLGKKYVIRHQSARGHKNYTALRDVLSEMIQAPFRRRAHEAPSTPMREEFWALKDISFEVKQGEAIGIIGRNGAGKSTLLKLLSRITEPTTGRIELNGRVASLLEVGTGFHPELTGRENIYLNGAIMGMSRVEIKRKFDEIVAFAEVDKFLDTPVKRYSSGMYMRLAFAVSAHLDSEILIVDEVLAVGDAAFQKKCLGKMQDVGQTGRTVLFVSHNTDALVRLCTSCVYLIEGRLEMIGETRHVIKAYSEHFKQAAGEIDLSSLPRAFEGTASARLLRLRSFQNETSAAYWCYEYGKPIGFTVEFSVSSLIENPELGYQIYSPLGVQLISSTTEQECPLDRLLPGRYSLRIIIPDLNLNPGMYLIGFTIITEMRHVDTIMEAAQFEIISTDHSIHKGLHKIWAPLTPETVFELNRL